MVEDRNRKSKKNKNVISLRSEVRCPECGKLSIHENYPFCSNRCRSLDLNRWLSGFYRIPVNDFDEEND